MEECIIYFADEAQDNGLYEALQEKLNVKTFKFTGNSGKLTLDADSLISAIVINLNNYDEKYLKLVAQIAESSHYPVFVTIQNGGDITICNAMIAAKAHLVLCAPFDYNVLIERLEALSKAAKDHYEKSWQEKTYNSLLFDMKTGIYSEKAFYNKAEKYIEENANKKLFAVTCEIEKFMQVVLSLGRTFSDNMLKYVAGRIKERCDSLDIPCGILENNAFAVICDESLIALDTLNTKIHGENFSDINREFGLIYGIYKITDKTMPLARIIRRSLAACAHATSRTMGYAVFDEKIRNDFKLNEFVMQNYRKAFTNHEFKVYYQPVVALNSNKVVSCEALARWIHPELGLIPPDRFIPLFEEHGIIPELDFCIWRQVCSDMRDRINTGTTHIVPISINMSRIDFYNDHLVEDLNGLLAEYNVDHKYIRIEITESALQDDDKKLYAMVEKLRNATTG